MPPLNLFSPATTNGHLKLPVYFRSSTTAALLPLPPVFGLPNELLFEITSRLEPADVLARLGTVQRPNYLSPAGREVKVTSVFAKTHRMVLITSDRHVNLRKQPMRTKRKPNRCLARKKVAENAKQQEAIISYTQHRHLRMLPLMLPPVQLPPLPTTLSLSPLMRQLPFSPIKRVL
jgi:hypothetical protein